MTSAIEDVGIPTAPFIYRSSGCAQLDIGEFRVQVMPGNTRDDDKTMAFACLLHDHAGALIQTGGAVGMWRRACEDRDKTIEGLEDKLSALRVLHPKTPVRLMGTGYVRFDPAGSAGPFGQAGKLWLLSKRETGWSAFGIPCADWDELFRRFNVRVTSHGTDEHGPWWAVENAS